MRKHTIAPERRSFRSKRKFAAAMSAAGLTISMLTLNFPAAAQSQQCAAREAVLERLSDHYHEEPVSIGVTATGSLLEVLASPEGSWTIIISVPGGPTCLVSSGEGWRGAPVQIAEEPGI
ncbi:MAG TPA: hypothetical protein VIR45_09745 [Kiloniellaceae bacterium]